MGKAKKFLEQIEKLDTMIENKLEEQHKWWAIATGTTAQMDGERVQASGNQQKMAEASMKHLSISKEIDECIDRLVDTKRDVISVIEQLPTQEYDVLHKRYVQGMELDEVARKKGKSYSWVTTVHGQALKKVNAILKEREGKEGYSADV